MLNKNIQKTNTSEVSNNASMTHFPRFVTNA